MNVVAVNVGARRVFVSRPDGSDAGRLSLDMVTTLALAKVGGGAVCLLRPSVLANEALFALTTDDVPVVRPRGFAKAWFRAAWQMQHAVERGGERASEASASFWREFYREIRRHVGDERLPSSLRTQLRGLARRSFTRATTTARTRYPRRLINERVKISLPSALLAEARDTAFKMWGPASAFASSFGGPPEPWRRRLAGSGAPVVAIDVRTNVEALFDAIDFLAAQGYTIVRLGDPSMGPLGRHGVIDLATSPQRTPWLEVFVLLISRFVVCGSGDVQHVAYLTNTPCLTINATDPFRFYPVRQDGLYILRKVIDLDTGRLLTTTDLLSETYFRNLRNYGYRNNTAREILEAVTEMHNGLQDGWRESDSQARFRTLVAEAGAALAPRVRQVAEWGPDRGFIGNGRLARVQADRAL